MSKADDRSTSTSVPTQMSPDGLRELAARLRAHSESEVLWDLPDGYRDDAYAASQVIDGIVKFQQADAVRAFLKLFNGEA
jgi:hypothetical protein